HQRAVADVPHRRSKAEPVPPCSSVAPGGHVQTERRLLVEIGKELPRLRGSAARRPCALKCHEQDQRGDDRRQRDSQRPSDPQRSHLKTGNPPVPRSPGTARSPVRRRVTARCATPTYVGRTPPRIERRYECVPSKSSRRSPSQALSRPEPLRRLFRPT